MPVLLLPRRDTRKKSLRPNFEFVKLAEKVATTIESGKKQSGRSTGRKNQQEMDGCELIQKKKNKTSKAEKVTNT